MKLQLSKKIKIKSGALGILANIYHRIQGFSTRNTPCHFLQSVVINRNKSFVMLTTRNKFYDVGRYAPKRNHVKFHLVAVCGFFFLVYVYVIVSLHSKEKVCIWLAFSRLILMESEINIIFWYHKNCILVCLVSVLMIGIKKYRLIYSII